VCSKKKLAITGDSCEVMTTPSVFHWGGHWNRKMKNCHIVFIKISTLKIQVLLLWPNLQQSWMLLCSSRKLLFTYQTTQYKYSHHVTPISGSDLSASNTWLDGSRFCCYFCSSSCVTPEAWEVFIIITYLGLSCFYILLSI